MPSFYPKTAFLPDGRKRRKARIPFRNNKISHLSAESRLVKGSLSNFGVLKYLCTPGEDMH